jgi:hypothetical protein
MRIMVVIEMGGVSWRVWGRGRVSCRGLCGEEVLFGIVRFELDDAMGGWIGWNAIHRSVEMVSLI